MPRSLPPSRQSEKTSFVQRIRLRAPSSIVWHAPSQRLFIVDNESLTVRDRACVGRSDEDAFDDRRA
jgi:hypothetical protein